MVFDVFRRERTDVFWVVGSGFKVRHAMETLPGAVHAGCWVPTLCETSLKIPHSTPYGQEPRSASITELCPECVEKISFDHHDEHVWDY